ncbi:ABC transporter permease [Streptomyces sp. NPDC093707]|uniref:ABC transporter permease n=1 Tax=Streptomyces sp. NPDC093707 TaxID=3154984 RepID=UPI00344F3232
MTSPQQPQPQPQPGAQPMPSSPAPGAGPMPPAAPQPPPPAQEAGTMVLKAQPLPPAQPPAGEHPEPRPLSAHGPGSAGGGTMLLKAAAPAPGPQPPQAPGPQQPPAPLNHQPPMAGYVSPLPVRPTHLGHALAAEWTKIRSVRSTVWTLGVMVALIVGVGLLAAAALSDVTVNPRIAFGFFSVMLGTLCIIPLGVLVVSSEYGTGMIRTTMTACPSRARVLGAKAIVFFLLAFVVTTLATTIVALAMAGIAGGRMPSVDEWLRATVGAGLYVSMLGLLSLALGSLLRHSAGAISAMFGVVLLPMLLAIFMLGAPSMRWLTEGLINYSIPNSLATLYGMSFLDSGPHGWTPLLILTVVAGVVLGAAFLVQEQRDV